MTLRPLLRVRRWRLLRILTLVLVGPGLLFGCRKKGPEPAGQLPPATQRGANTFGCLVNGRIWTPSGNNGRPNLAVDYDPTYRGGALQVKVYRYTGAGSGVLQSLTCGVEGLTSTGKFTFLPGGANGISYSDFGVTGPQSYYSSSLQGIAYADGTLTVTRFDGAQHIVAGTFSFVLAHTGGDTLKITQGEFDARFN